MDYTRIYNHVIDFMIEIKKEISEVQHSKSFQKLSIESGYCSNLMCVLFSRGFIG
jgi:hypothetical protein